MKTAKKVMANIKGRQYRVKCDTTNQMNEEAFNANDILIGAETREHSYGGTILVHRPNETSMWLLYVAELDLLDR